jgi:hypothetical protein
LLLIINNLDSTMSTSADVFTTIIRSWKNAMRVLDRLIAGTPQSVQDPEVLLGLSAWHLYPDMMVVGEKAKHVNQNDKLVSAGGVMTLGLSHPVKDGSQGIDWSLPLSHLRYYGNPVSSTRELNICSSRISFDQLLFLSLGSITRSWSCGAETVCRLVLALSRVWQNERSLRPEWLTMLARAAQWFETLADREKEQAEQIFYLGRRRCDKFFCSSASSIPVAFGLCNIANFIKVLPGAESRIAWLRQFCCEIGVPAGTEHNAMVEYYTPTNDVIALDNARTFDESAPCAATLGEDSASARHQKRSDAETTVPRGASRTGTPFRCPEHECLSRHSGHPDSLHTTWDSCYVRSEFASLYPFAEKGKAACYKRWIPADQATRKSVAEKSVADYSPPFDSRDNLFETLDFEDDQLLGKPFVPSDGATLWSPMECEECPWELPNYDSPSTASVKRMSDLSLMTGDDCGLFHVNSYADTKLSGRNTLPSRFPKTFPLRPLCLANARSGEMESGNVECGDQRGRCLICYDNSWPITYGCDRPSKKRRIDKSQGCCSKWYMPQLGDAPHDRSHWSFEYFLGDPETAAVYVPMDAAARPPWVSAPKVLEIDYVVSCLDQGYLTPESVSKWLHSPPEDFWNSDVKQILLSVSALVIAADIYKDLPSCTVDIGVTSKPLNQARWLTQNSKSVARQFSCIAMFENGGLDIDPEQLTNAVALSTGNSLHIAAHLLRDPWYQDHDNLTIHTIGNVGKTGVCFLISPTEPLIYQPEKGMWQLIRHAAFDGRLESNIIDTTLHLSFTGYEFPLRTTDHDAFDKEAFFIGAALKAYGGREWVADLDILAALRSEDQVERLLPCVHPEECRQKFDHMTLTSVDSWIEFLDAPMTAFIVRAKGDWISRLALYAVAMQTRRPLILAFDWMCWLCVKNIAESWAPPGESLDYLWSSDNPSKKLMILC